MLNHQTVDEITDGILGDIIAELLREKANAFSLEEHAATDGDAETKKGIVELQTAGTGTSSAASDSASPSASFGVASPEVEGTKPKKAKKEKKDKKEAASCETGAVGDQETTLHREKKSKKEK